MAAGAAVDPAVLGVDPDKLKQALDDAFAEPGPDNPRKTRAVAVVYDGQLVAERYAPGFGPEMPILGWSMSKSVTNALVGILVRQGRSWRLTNRHRFPNGGHRMIREERSPWTSCCA